MSNSKKVLKMNQNCLLCIKLKFLGGLTDTLPQLGCSRAKIGMDFLCTLETYFCSVTNDFWRVQKFMFLIVTSKRIKLQSPAKSQTVGNSFTLLYLMWIFNIGWDSTEILLPEVEQFFKNEISLLSVNCKNYVFHHNF